MASKRKAPEPEVRAAPGKLDAVSIGKIAKKLPLLGPVVWLLMQDVEARSLPIAELEWRVFPPLALNQLKLFMKDQLPLGYVSWACLSPEVAARYRHSSRLPVPADWSSGSEIWFVDAVAPFGGATALIDEVRLNVFPSQPSFRLVQDDQGTTQVQEYPPAAHLS